MTLKTFLAAATGAALLGGTAYAAHDGNLGGTSTGDITINSTKQAGVRITELDDVTFSASTTTPPAQNDPVCVYSTTGSYLITASSGNASGTAFRLRNGANYISYAVGWYPVSTGGSATALASGTQSGTITGADATSETCATTIDTARVEITVDNTSFSNAPAGTYNDTLTVVVAPQ
jgi:hypothetical protein